MEAANSTKITEPQASTAIGELVLQNGRQAGTRRPLGVPTTFIGRGQGCDIRLNIDGVDPMHCVLVFGSDGLTVRDLNSTHGTFVNGERVDTQPIQHGEVLKVGPFQFRVELSASALLEYREHAHQPGDSLRESAQIQVAAVAAQQIALEEEESRLVQRQSDMMQQEEQLATHLAEKQRQVQMWSEHTKQEREALRKQKTEQQKFLSQLEQELNESKEHLGEEQQQLIQERHRINKIYQRLRQRWQRQWTAEKEKYQDLAEKLEADTQSLEARQNQLREQEAVLAQEVARFQAERDQTARQLHESAEALKNAQLTWKRRHTHERTLWKSRQQELEETLARMNEARQLLHQEKESWQKQRDALHKELHGLNNRVVHQRQKVKEQEDRLFSLDQELRTRLLHLQRVAEIESAAGASTDASGTTTVEEPVGEENASSEETALTIVPSTELAVDRSQFEALDRLAGELADQRLHLVEQYKRLAEIQEIWSLQREQAADELHAMAQTLHEQEQALLRREEEALSTEQNLQQEHEEIRGIRHEIQIWRARLKAREQALEQDYQKRLLTQKQQEMLLQEQLTGLTYLRQRWNRRRQEEIDHIRAEQAQLKQQREEATKLRQELFDKGQQLEEEKRILAEKALAVELYRDEVARRSNDPAAQRRIERLRRRWLMQNAAVLRNAKREREVVHSELTELGSRCQQWVAQMEQVSQADAILAEKLSLLEEREALLQTRELRVEQEAKEAEAMRQDAEEKYLRMKDEVEQMAQLVYEEPESAPRQNDRAA